MLACPGRVSRRKGAGPSRLGLVRGLYVAYLTRDCSRMPPESAFATISGGSGGNGGRRRSPSNDGHGEDYQGCADCCACAKAI